jgi:transposase
MRDTSLLQLALGLTPPWTVTRADFDPEARRLDIEIDFAPGSRFACPACGAADCPAYDSERKTWRHLDFFQHQAYLNARVPRVRCQACGVKTVGVPWARPDSGFTLLFEALVMTMIAAMPVNAVARMVGEHDTKLWRVVHHYVDQGRARIDASDVTKIAVDETAARRGHDYISLFVDIDQARVLFATEGKDAATVAAFATDLATHGGDPQAIEEVCIDMSPAFIKGVGDSLPNAAITFDKFHAVKIVNDAVDQVRRAEQKSQGLLRGTRYLWLRNPANLSDRQQATLAALPTRHLKTARAYQIRLAFQEFYAQPSPQTGVAFLKKWYFWATHSRLPPMIDAAHTVKRHWDGVVRWFDSRIANGRIEGINSLVQAAKAKARGYRSMRNLKAIGDRDGRGNRDGIEPNWDRAVRRSLLSRFERIHGRSDPEPHVCFPSCQLPASPKERLGDRTGPDRRRHPRRSRPGCVEEGEGFTDGLSNARLRTSRVRDRATMSHLGLPYDRPKSWGRRVDEYHRDTQSGACSMKPVTDRERRDARGG